jgi:hypothetical protein
VALPTGVGRQGSYLGNHPVGVDTSHNVPPCSCHCCCLNMNLSSPGIPAMEPVEAEAVTELLPSFWSELPPEI